MKKAQLLLLAIAAVFSTSNVGFSQTSTAPSERYFEAVYESAAVYAGRTDFVFTTTEGNQITLSNHRLEEDQQWDPAMPDNMLENKEASPSANPDMIGKTFLLIFADGGDGIVEARLKE